MGQANRSNFKTKADSSFRFGNFGQAIGGVVNKAINNVNKQVAQTRAAVYHTTPAPVASRPVPKLNSAYLGAYPASKHVSDLQKQINDFYGSMKTKVTDPIKTVASGHPTDDAWREKDVLDVAGVGNEVLGGLKDAVQGNALNPFRQKKNKYEAPDRPGAQTLEELRKNVDLALRDNTWSPEERQQIVSSYRNFVNKFVADDADDLKSINNWSVQSAFKQLVAQARKEQAAGEAKGGDSFLDMFGLAGQDVDKTDLGEFYSGELLSAKDDKYGPGFILSADEDGWFKIVSIKDLQHEIGAQARDNPAFAARLIAGMAAYGAYGAGTDKYAGGRIQYDKKGNPVNATFNVDDDNALVTFLGLIAKDQEQAMNAQELQPWDALMDQHAAQNSQIAATPSYGNQDGTGGAGRGRRGFGGGGFGGGGGGGGVSYTDSDQLKQLINGIARSRLGYTLNDQQIAEFVTEYHSKEAAFVGARIAGKDAQQLDPESQAASWIESHFRDAMASNQANNYISSLASFLLGGSFGSTS